MSLLDLLTERAVIVGLQGTEKPEIIEELVNVLEPGERILDRRAVVEAVLDRERIMSTGIGNGLAIPHAKTDFVAGLAAAFGTKKEGADVGSLDGEPAYIFFMLASPKDASAQHVRTLASVSRLLRDGDCRKKLIEARTAREIISIIARHEAQNADSDR